MKIAILGNGQLGLELYEDLKNKYDVTLFSFPSFNICNNIQLCDTIKNNDLIINCAANINVDKIENEDEIDSYNVNYLAVKNLAIYCRYFEKQLVHISTDYVYGSNNYSDILNEEYVCNPINKYGQDKFCGELAIRVEKLKSFLILRVSGVYGKYGVERRVNFIEKIKYGLKNNSEIKVVDDQIGNLTSTKLIIESINNFIENKIPSGTYNLMNDGDVVSRFDIANFIKECIKSNCNIVPCKTNEFKLPAERQLNSNMSIEKIKQYMQIKHWKDAVKEYLEETK